MVAGLTAIRDRSARGDDAISNQRQISTGYTGLVFLDFEQDDNIWSPPQNPARTEELRRKRARFASKLIPAQSR